MSAQRIEIHVEELVLHGFPPLDRHALREAVERELATRLTELPLTGTAARISFVGSGNSEPIRLAPDAMVQSLGGGLAVAISSAISRRMGR